MRKALKQRTIEELARALGGRGLLDEGGPPYYSVLAPLVERNGKLHVLYESRSEKLRRQPGEVSFPGGRIENNETPEECAVRETMEELGVKRESISVLGELDRVVTHDGFPLRCYLARLEDSDFGASFNTEEVKEVFLAPVDFLVSHKPVKRAQWLEYHYEGRVIWGLTARLTMKLVREIASV
jgi:8-oxo-dGTP pyrophosphatase MutT (NUDIX family)